MKKGKPTISQFDVDGPFLRSKQILSAFGESMAFSAIVQATVKELEKCEEEFEAAIFMGDTELALEKKKEKEEIMRSLTFAASLLESDDGISA